MTEKPKSARQQTLERVLACQETLLRKGKDLSPRQNLIYCMALMRNVGYLSGAKEIQDALIQACATALTCIEGLELEI